MTNAMTVLCGRSARAPALAFDRSLRSIDADGHMRVAESRISKANVCPYFGREIPDFERLGLDPSRTYLLFRDPKELAKGASTFDGKPLLVRHVPIDAELPRKELWVGTVGNCEFVEPYLVTRPLMVLTKEAIDLIESEAQRELSAAYRYDAVMEPGVWGGTQYDGRMVNIRGNHVAIVSEGRAGPDVHVADEQPPEFRRMSRKATLAAALATVLAGVLPEGTDKRKVAIALDGALGETPAESVISLDAEEMKACDEQCAKDATEARGADAEPSEEEKEAAYKKARDKKAKDKRAKDKAAKDKAAKDAAAAKDKARDKDPDAADEEPTAADEDPDHRKDFDPIKAKDELSRELKAQFRATAEARELVRPLVGVVSMALDEAPAIYRHALKAVGVDAKDVHESALKPMVEMAISNRARPSSSTKVAMDADSRALCDVSAIFGPQKAA